MCKRFFKVYQKTKTIWVNSAVFLVVLLLLTSCKTRDQEDADFDPFVGITRVENSDYETKEIDLLSLGIEKASGIEFDKENKLLYITDRSNQKVKVFDANLKEIDSIKNDRMKFPSILCKKDEFLYVLDDKTRQLFRFTKDNELKDIIKLPKIEQHSLYSDMDLTGDDIYITMNTPYLKDSKIFKISGRNHKTSSLKDEFDGFVFADEDRVYFVNSLVSYQKPGEEGFIQGKNELFELRDDKIHAMGNFIEKSAPGDFFMDENFKYVYTASWSSIDRYDKDFKYIDSIAVFSDSDFDSWIKGDNEKLFILMPNLQKLYEVYKK